MQRDDCSQESDLFSDEDDENTDSAFTKSLKRDLNKALHAAVKDVYPVDYANEVLSTTPLASKPFAAASPLDLSCTAFARTHDLPFVLNPGLYVGEIGRINLPLLEADASAIIQLATREPVFSELADANAKSNHGVVELDAFLL